MTGIRFGFRRARVAALLLAVAAARCASAPPAAAPTPPPPSETVRVQVNGTGGAGVRRVALDEYVAGSLAAELGGVVLDPVIGRSAARLQALLARTYALSSRGRHTGYDLCDTTHCQLYRPAGRLRADIARAARAAARDTSGLAVLFRGRPIQALFHADCGGHTSSASVVWGGPAPPYLGAVRDPFCPATRDPWRFAVPADALRDALNADGRTQVGSYVSRLDPLKVDRAGRIVRLALDGERSPVVRGEELRQVLVRRFGPLSVRSTRFTVRREREMFVFDGRGFGHGVGLCQAGALAQLRQGRTPEQILETYFPGTRVARPTNP